MSIHERVGAMDFPTVRALSRVRPTHIQFLLADLTIDARQSFVV